VISSYQNFLCVFKLTITIFMFQVDYSVLESSLITFHCNLSAGYSLTIFHPQNISVLNNLTVHILFGIVFLCCSLFTLIICTNEKKRLNFGECLLDGKLKLDYQIHNFQFIIIS
jgi:hypothetical protein